MSKIISKRLGDIVNFKRGFDLPESKRKKGLFPVISSSGISGFHSEYKCDGIGLITGRYGTLGEMYYYEGKYWPHNTTLYATTFYSNHPKYVYYLMKCLGNLKTSDKSTVPGINRNDLHEINIPYNTDFNHQVSIAKILSSLDAKIKLNNRINAELETMAKTLYDYWFVQFDFPTNFEAGISSPYEGEVPEGRRGYKSSGGKMVYNKELKREIPEGWEVKRLIQVCKNIGDGIHGTPKYVAESEYYFINGNNLKNGFIQFNKETKNVSKSEFEKYYISLDENSILLSINGTLGNLAIYLGEKVMLGKSSAYINSIEQHRDFCYYFLSQPNIQKKFWLIATGSTIKNLSLASLKSLKLSYPNKELIKQFNSIINPITQKRINIFKQNQHLASLRDWLLPMLMNGQVTVGGAGKKMYLPKEEAWNVAAEPGNKIK